MAAGDIIKGIGVATTKGDAFKIFSTTSDVDPFTPKGAKSGTLQTALEDAIKAVATPNGQVLTDPRDPTDATTFNKTFPLPITIADITDGIAGGVHVAHYNGDEMDFVGSEAKVPVMYAAFQLRNMVQRFANELDIKTKKDLFPNLHKLDPFILANDKVPMLKSPKDIEGKKVAITNAMRLPQYERMLKVTEGVGPVAIAFDGALAAASTVPTTRKSSSFGQSLFEMIVHSDDPLAARCIDMIGFSFLNGSLVAGGYFDVDAAHAEKSKGLWVSGDYASRELRAVMTVNDGAGKLAGTTRRFAQMMAAIQLDLLKAVDPGGDMRSLLSQAVSGTNVALDLSIPGGIAKAHYVANKIGFAELGRRFGKEPLTYSELSLFTSAPPSSKKYAVGWQNLHTKKPKMVSGKPVWEGWPLYHYGHVASIIRATVAKYEGLAAGADPFP